MSNLEMSGYEYFKYWLKHLTDEDIGTLMLAIPFVSAILILLVVLALHAAVFTLIIVVIFLWFGTAVYFLTKS